MSEPKYCECGCGREIIFKKHHKYHKPRFITGHNWEGKKHSEETRAKISAANMGRHNVSAETKAKWHISRLGNTNSLGKKRNLASKEKMRNAKLGKKAKPETIALLRDGRRKGENNARWKGGISQLPHLLRTNFQYRQWRSDIFTRDNFTCIICGDNKGGNLCAHHHPTTLLSIINEYKIETSEQALLCEKIWDINNGVTLCEECHRKVHSGKLSL